MATTNFTTMERFDLFAAHTPRCKVCPECGMTMDGEATECECGASLEEVEAIYDEIGDADQLREVGAAMEKLNDGYEFHELSVRGGYYTGTQFYVDEKFHGGYERMEDYDNEDAQYYYGMCRSALLRKYGAEVRRIRRDMVKLAEEFGYMRLLVVGRFSNGEAVYELADGKKAGRAVA